MICVFYIRRKPKLLRDFPRNYLATSSYINIFQNSIRVFSMLKFMMWHFILAKLDSFFFSNFLDSIKLVLVLVTNASRKAVTLTCHVSCIFKLVKAYVSIECTKLHVNANRFREVPRITLAFL